jgi:hypothetical protein
MVAEGQLAAVRKLTENSELTTDQAVALITSGESTLNKAISRGGK